MELTSIFTSLKMSKHSSSRTSRFNLGVLEATPIKEESSSKTDTIIMGQKPTSSATLKIFIAC